MSVLLSIVEKNLRIFPKNRITPDLLKYIAENKISIVNNLKELRQNVGTMSLKEFSKRNIAIKVNSEILNEDIYFVSNKKVRDLLLGSGLTTYLPAELNHLISINITAVELQRIHMVKRNFVGSTINNKVRR